MNEDCGRVLSQSILYQLKRDYRERRREAGAPGKQDPEVSRMQSPLHALELDAGATFGHSWDWEIADSFGDASAEYQAVRTGCGVLDLSHTGKFQVTGRDRVRYLHNMLSNDIKKLQTGNGCHATLLTRQGRMETDLHVVAFPDHLWLECPLAGAATALKTLNQYIVGDVVSIEDASLSYAILSLQGPGSRETMELATEVALEGMAPLQVRRTGEGSSFVVRRDRTGCGGYDLWLPAGAAEAIWLRWTREWKIRPVGFLALNWLRTEAGIPWFGYDMDESNLPMEFGLESAISMTKGCYRGQEIVARVTHRGHLDRKLAGVAFEDDTVPEKGWEVFAEGNKIGTVTSATTSPALGRPLALCILNTGYLQPGTKVEVAGRAARVIHLPIH
jgi:folate-binding protein YgfZ